MAAGGVEVCVQEAVEETARAERMFWLRQLERMAFPPGAPPGAGCTASESDRDGNILATVSRTMPSR